jgi:hypothetical protein
MLSYLQGNQVFLMCLELGNCAIALQLPELHFLMLLLEWSCCLSGPALSGSCLLAVSNCVWELWRRQQWRQAIYGGFLCIWSKCFAKVAVLWLGNDALFEKWRGSSGYISLELQHDIELVRKLSRTFEEIRSHLHQQ